MKMRKCKVFIISIVASAMLWVTMLAVGSPQVASAAGPNINASNETCSGTDINFYNLTPGSSVFLLAFTYNSVDGSFVQDLADEAHQVANTTSVTFSPRWPTLSQGLTLAGSPVLYQGQQIQTAIAINMEVDSPGGGFTLFNVTFLCTAANATAGPPPNSVLASFAGETQLYSAPDLKTAIPGLTLHAGQTWFIFELSKDKKFYHVYITGGQSAWVLVGSAKLQGNLPGAASDEDDNGTTASTTTTSQTTNSTTGFFQGTHAPLYGNAHH